MPRTELLGETSRYVKEGSQVSLHCIVTGAIDPPLYIIWYHGSAQIFPDDRRGWRMDINRESVHANPKHGTVLQSICLPLLSICVCNVLSNEFRLIFRSDRHAPHTGAEEARQRQLHVRAVEQPADQHAAARH